MSEHIVTAHCYAVHQRVLGRLTEFLRTIEQRERHHPLGGRMHFDGALNVFCDQNPDVRRFRPSQNLVMQRSSKSDIAGPARFDRHRTTRMAVRAARAMKNRLRRRRVTGAAGS